jgi:hypothetical protein
MSGSEFDLDSILEENVLKILQKTEPAKYLYDIFIICPVRDATDEQNRRIEAYVHKQEAAGRRVYWPRRDTNQVDPSGGLRICIDNALALYLSREAHVFYAEKSEGSKFDFGIAFGLRRPIILINPEDVARKPGKSFNNVILDLHRIYYARLQAMENARGN